LNMADIGTFPTIRNVLVDGDNIKSYTVGGTLAVKAGMTLAFHGTGVSNTVQASVKGTTVMPVGVALYDAAVGAQVAVACRGCRVYVANAESDVAIDAGDPLEDNDNAIGGTVSAAALVIPGAVAVVQYVVGFAEEDIAASATGIMSVAPQIMTAANNA